jgi:hypothetical protein
MNRLMSSLAALITVCLAQGCATTTQPTVHDTRATALDSTSRVAANACVGPQCAADVLQVAHRTEIQPDKNAPTLQGHPLTSVVVTQCNLIVAVYMTMPDGKLLRFDKSANVPPDQLLEMAYTATRSERVEVSCNDDGAVGYEKHDPV